MCPHLLHGDLTGGGAHDTGILPGNVKLSFLQQHAQHPVRVHPHLHRVDLGERGGGEGGGKEGRRGVCVCVCVCVCMHAHIGTCVGIKEYMTSKHAKAKNEGNQFRRGE